MHVGSRRLLTDFPLARVRSWLNTFAAGDLVPAGRGLSHLFPHALDLRIDLTGGPLQRHAAESYLSHRAVCGAVGEGLFGSLRSDVALVRTDVTRRLRPAEAVIVAGLAYGHYLADELTKDGGRQARFRAALFDVQGAVVSRLRSVYEGDVQGFPAQLGTLEDGRRPTEPVHFSISDSVPALLSILAGNVIAPYEIEVGDKEKKRALERLAAFVEYPQDRASRAFEAFEEARKALKSSGWGWLLWAAAGLALIIAGPVGLVLAAPAGVSGAAAIVGAPGAFGPGGMVGGLVTAGALAGAGAGLTGVAATLASSASAETVLGVVVQQLATAIVRKKLQDPNDYSPWFVLSNLEMEIARECQRLESYSDPKAATISIVRRKADIVRLALRYMMDNGLSPVNGDGA